MITALLKRLTTSGFRRGISGSRAWLIVGIATGGIRLLHRVSKDKPDVLYRTVVKPGDVFEVVTRPPK
jgi:hypothetical protein